MTRYISSTDTAKLVREALAKAFPGQKFNVRTKKYAGGASVDVTWIDGPTNREVDNVAGVFSGSTFDGMIDLKSYVTSNWNGEEVHFGADHICCQRQLSDYALITILNEYRAMWGGTDGEFIPGHDFGKFQTAGHVSFEHYDNQDRYFQMQSKRTFYQAPTVAANDSEVELMLANRDF